MFSLEDFRSEKSVMLDTCFVLYELLNQRDERLFDFCRDNTVLFTSFNVEELRHVSKKLGHDKKKVRRFLDCEDVNFVDVPVSLGEVDKEKSFVSSLSDNLLKKVHDPSDAVLVAAAIRSGSDILTRDKHHLFTVELGEELKSYGLCVFNDISSFDS